MVHQALRTDSVILWVFTSNGTHLYEVFPHQAIHTMQLYVGTLLLHKLLLMSDRPQCTRSLTGWVHSTESSGGETMVS